MTALDRWLAKPHKFFLWAFTGLIVTTTVITLLEPYQKGNGNGNGNGNKSIKDAKRKKQPKTAEELERDGKDVNSWSKKELFDYLTRVSVVVYFLDCLRIRNY